MKHSYKTKNNKKAFTLIELLIVIAIIGILFIVLVSKVDFATDKAKATGVQTDFRSFQMAFDTVAKENAGFNTFGWDTGDLNQDGKRNSYDEGDNGAGGGTANNGIQDGTEVFTGHKVYVETFTKVYSLKKAKSDGTLETNYDRGALNRLETAINANLDPKLHITIKDDGEIVMANGAQDPWKNEYHGWYISKAAEQNGADRGAIVMYSDGANGVWGSAHDIDNGVVSVTVPNSNKDGKDDYSLVSVYTYVNGYGEVKNITTGFSNNQKFLAGSNTTSIDTILNSDGKFVNQGTKYYIVSAFGQYMIIDNEFNVHLYDYHDNLQVSIPGQCLTIDNESILINNTGTDIDGARILFKNNGNVMYTIDEADWQGRTEYAFAIKEGTCTHQQLDAKTWWYYWADENMNEISFSGSERMLFEQLKQCTLRCGVCLTEIPTRFYEDSDYIYIYNGYFEPQLNNGNRINGSCVDAMHSDFGGWVAVPYDVAHTNNLYKTIDGQPVRLIIGEQGQYLPVN